MEVAVESRAKLLGHPVHPMLVVLPLGLFLSAVFFDGLAIWRTSEPLATTAFYNVGAGVLGGLTAAVFGLVDWLAIPAQTRAKKIGMFHGLVNLIVLVCFGVSWLARSATHTRVLSGEWYLAEVFVLMLALVAGWLGGELVDRLSVGVDDGANLNASNSIRARAARFGR